MTFSSYWNSFLAMYQIYSSENWTDVANNVLTAEMGIFQLFCAAVFLSAWLLTGYFILLGLFVSVISENFALAEDDKHQQQMKAYIKRNEPVVDQRSYFQRLNPYYRAATRPASVHLASIGPPTEKRVILDDMSVSRVDERMKSTDGPDAYLKARRERQALRLNVRTVSAGSHAATDGVELPVDVMLDDGDADPARSVARRRRAHQLEMIAARPSYDVSLWLFSQGNPIRRFCQRLVEPANDEERINGRPSVRRERIAFQVLVFSGVLGSIVIAAYATPVYRRTSFLDNGPIRFTWFNLTEATLSITLIVEFLVKILADGTCVSWTFLADPSRFHFLPQRVSVVGVERARLFCPAHARGERRDAARERRRRKSFHAVAQGVPRASSDQSFRRDEKHCAFPSPHAIRS